MGVESTLDWQLRDDLNLIISYTYTDTEDEATGARLARRPLHQTSLSLSYDFNEKFNAIISMTAANSRIDTNENDSEDYVRWDLTLNYDINDKFSTYLKVHNLFDEDYTEIPGYINSPSFIMLGVELKF